jgi:dihydrofolate reductase
LEETLKQLKEENKDVWVIGGASIYGQAMLTDYIDLLDITILNKVYVPKTIKNTDDLTFFPQIPYNYTIEHEYIDENDKTLLHRIYKKIVW